MPLLKWPGGKRKLVPLILRFVPSIFKNYYEPFLGGGAVFFAIRPQRAFLSDRNPELISTYTQIRDRPQAVIRDLQKLRNTETDYYAIRASIPRSESQRAARLIYLSTLSFNGIHRVNLKGVFNVPYGYKTHLKPCAPERIYKTSEVLRSAEIRCQDFEATVSMARKRGSCVSRSSLHNRTCKQRVREIQREDLHLE